MSEIKQTSQAILFEEFNSSKDDLRTMLNTSGNVDSSTFVVKVSNTLGVSSFKEFLEKFSPEMWEYFANRRFYYTTDAEEAKKHNGVPKSITDNKYYQMLVNMYVQKGISGQANSEFDDTDLLDMLSPQAEVKEAKRLRANFEYVTKEYYKALDAGENTEELQAKIYDCRDRIIDKYQESKVSLLPLAINDASQKIKALEKSKESIQALPNGSESKSQAGQFSFDAEGNICTIAAEPKTEQQDDRAKHNVAGDIKMMIEADYEENFLPVSVEDESGTFIKNMMVSVYTPNGGSLQTLADQPMTEEEINQELAVLEDQKAEYEKYYTDAKESFIQELSKIIEKVIGVKIFFDHATAKSGDDAKLELPTGLIIANCKPADLVEESLKAKFETYINDIGKSQGKGKCWFAILPSVKYLNSTPIIKQSVDEGNSLLRGHKRTKVQDAAQQRTGDSLTLPVAKSILNILNKGHILTVFDFATFKGNTFGDITDEVVAEVKKKLQDYGIDYSHAIYAYPNFTLMNERRITITDEADARKIVVPGIHIDAAYPAAGLLVASQQLSTLKSRGLGDYLITDKDNMNPVRIDLENPLLQRNLTTKFNRENVMNWSLSVLEEIQKDMFGFAFCGNEQFGNIENTYILTARTMKKMKNQQYTPIYRVMMEDFIFQICRLLGRKQSQIEKELLHNLVPQWKQLAKRYEFDPKVNLVLLKKGSKEEDINWKDDTHKTLIISFVDGEETQIGLDIISDDVSDKN